MPYQISRVIATHIYEYKCAGTCACIASRKTEECNCFVDSLLKKILETKRAMRRVQICIDKYLVNHILNKFETIFISILNVIYVFLYIYFGD